MISPFLALACPLDGTPLHGIGPVWSCAAGHSFDVSSHGYIHLLPVQRKRSKDPGDSKEMVAARRRFLAEGAYQPVAQAINRMTLAGLPADAAVSCLDAGCGEGYYLAELAKAASPQQDLALLGLDISKWAVLAAAKRYKDPCWVVGTNAQLPVQAGTLDRVLCIFGFPVYSEFARVLQPHGQLIQVDAGPDHLRELRQIIYPVLKTDRDTAVPAPLGFTLAGTESVRYGLQLDGAHLIADLLAMTPHLYRASPEGRARAAALTSLELTIDVRLSLYETTA